MSTTVRPAEDGDVPRLATIEESADQLLVQQLGSALFGEAPPGRSRVDQPGFVLVAGRPCVGFAHVLTEAGGAHLQQVAVDPRHGRQGIGTALVEACCDLARQRGHDEITLTTFRDLPFNAPWYARLGFVIVAEPVGAPARHLAQESEYSRLSPRVAMRRALTG